MLSEACCEILYYFTLLLKKKDWKMLHSFGFVASFPKKINRRFCVLKLNFYTTLKMLHGVYKCTSFKYILS